MEILVVARRADPEGMAPHREEVLRGVPARLLPEDRLRDPATAAAVAGEFEPDVVAVPGWNLDDLRRAVFRPPLAGIPLVMAMDNPWRATWRQRLGRLRHPRYFRRVDAVMTAGERSRQLALRLGFPARRIRTGMYTYDAEIFEGAAARRHEVDRDQRRFLFVGRCILDKGIDVLADGYRRYRRAVADPWPLACCGRGPRADLLEGREGVEILGFLQGEALARAMAESSVLVLPSRLDHWGVVLAEAAAAGLAIVCTTTCGGSVELVRHRWNGLLVPPADPESLAGALVWCHRNGGDLREMGCRSRDLAAAFAPSVWADRWEEVLEEAMITHEKDDKEGAMV